MREKPHPNCWEFKDCGRQPGGNKVAQYGVCPATIETKLDGVNEGRNAGRACWVVAGTFCGGIVQGTYANKIGNCAKCDFYKSVSGDQEDFVFTSDLLKLVGAL